jgi:sugar phosphate isomerase/epimerase
LRLIKRRHFLEQSAATAATALLWPGLKGASVASSGPNLQFPTTPRERIAIASYPFREFVAGAEDSTLYSAHKMDLREFLPHVKAKFNINKIEPWSEHFHSQDAKYLDEFRASVDKTGGAIVNIAVDGKDSPFATDKAEREKAIAFSRQWIDVAAVVGSPSVRTNMPPAKHSKPDVKLAVESLLRVVEYASTKSIVVNLENDNPLSEDPFFIVTVIEKVNSPWLHANPDFANTLATGKAEYAYKGIEAMFGHAYNICHVKAMESLEGQEDGKLIRVDLTRTFGILRKSDYRGYCSMEFDSPGDPYQGTSDLIEKTLHYLS